MQINYNNDWVMDNIPGLIDSWYELAENDCSNTTKITLLAKKTQIFNNVMMSCNDRYDPTLCNFIIKEFEKRGVEETQCFADWIGRNSQCMNEKIEGAYKSWHEIFVFITYHKGYRCNGEFDVFNAANRETKEITEVDVLLRIDFAARDSLKRATEKAAKRVPELSLECIELISHNPILKCVSKEYKEAYDFNSGLKKT